MLLVTDRELPSVTSMVTGEDLSGSWWSHPRAREIYAVLTRLEEDPSLLLVKLISGKETFVHRALWPELVAVATSRDGFQTRGLKSEARELLGRVEAAGHLRLDTLASGPELKSLRRAARTLEQRLLVHGRQVHTESGAHQKVLASWTAVARDRDVTPYRGDLDAARAALASRTEGKLPWQGRRG